MRTNRLLALTLGAAMTVAVALACEQNSSAQTAVVVLPDTPGECHTIAIRFSRRAPYHGNFALWKPVEEGRIEVKLGPEFASHRYGVDAIHIECRNEEGNIIRMMDNSEAIYIRPGVNVIDRNQFVTR